MDQNLVQRQPIDGIYNIHRKTKLYLVFFIPISNRALKVCKNPINRPGPPGFQIRLLIANATIFC